MVPIVERDISRKLSSQFEIIFDGWSDNHIHYVALLASYNSDNVHKELILACAPSLKKDDLVAEHHFDFVNATLEGFKKQLKDVVCVIWDNCATNAKLFIITEIPVCASHKFKLEINHCTSQQSLLSAGLNVRRV